MNTLPLATGIAAAPTRAGVGTYASAIPAAADWLDTHPDIADILDLGQRVLSALSASADGSQAATSGTLAALNDARAARNVYIEDCKRAGLALDPKKLERFDAAILRARSAHDDAGANATANSLAVTLHRQGFSTAVKLINDIATTGSDVAFVEPAKTRSSFPRGAVAEQRALLDALDAEERAVKRAPIPLGPPRNPRRRAGRSDTHRGLSRRRGSDFTPAGGRLASHLR